MLFISTGASVFKFKSHWTIVIWRRFLILMNNEQCSWKSSDRHIGHFRWLGPNVWWEISQILTEYIKPIGLMSDESWKFFGYTGWRGLQWSSSPIMVSGSCLGMAYAHVTYLLIIHKHENLTHVPRIVVPVMATGATCPIIDYCKISNISAPLLAIKLLITQM